MKNAPHKVISANTVFNPTKRPNIVQDIQFESLTLEDTGHLLAPPASGDGHLVISNHRRRQLTLTPAGQDEYIHVCVVIQHKL